MSDLHIQRRHGMTLKQARVAAEHIADELAGEFSIDYEWRGNTCHFHRTGISGTMVLDKRDIAIEARIGFLLFPLKSRIEHEIHKFCDENFGPESP